MSAHLPEPGDYRGHGSPNIQGSTVLAGPRSNKKKEKKMMSRKHKTTHKKIKKNQIHTTCLIYVLSSASRVEKFSFTSAG